MARRRADDGRRRDTEVQAPDRGGGGRGDAPPDRQPRHRAGRRRAAREPLRSALATFELLGADAWAGRARLELEASGERLPLDAPGLTAQERRVADAVAVGATNREVAAALHLSPRTVEYHLRKVFRKLGVRSRTELSRALRQDAAEV